jgi:transposase-like protein
VSHFNEATKQALLLTGFVLKITDKQVVFSPAFKLRAVAEHKKGKSPEEIFSQVGINPAWLSKDYCAHCLKRWRKKVRESGEESLLKDTRGRPRKNKSVDDLDSYTKEELKDVIRLQELFIENLKKQKALSKRK